MPRSTRPMMNRPESALRPRTHWRTMHTASATALRTTSWPPSSLLMTRKPSRLPLTKLSNGLIIMRMQTRRSTRANRRSWRAPLRPSWLASTALPQALHPMQLMHSLAEPMALRAPRRGQLQTVAQSSRRSTKYNTINTTIILALVFSLTSSAEHFSDAGMGWRPVHMTDMTWKVSGSVYYFLDRVIFINARSSLLLVVDDNLILA
mmetsp:Transcript_1175/g.1793  ORF Transcript_1175/g.1793 Transcript_1175/m.1793 type:complete len:206 (+) Transcript_1175:828-1445(+)